MTRLSLAAALVVGCALKDIRPPEVLDRPAAAAVERGAAVVQAMADAHGIAAWRQADEIRMVFDDHWPNGMMRSFGTPLRDARTRIELTFVPGSGFRNELRFLDGKRAGDGAAAEGTTTFAVRDGARIAKSSMKYEVYGPATQYLWELPFRMATDPDTVVWAREDEERGRPVDVVLATWGGVQARSEVDQYVLFVDQQTRHLLRADYTVRAGGRIFASTVRFEDHADYDGMTLPANQQVDQIAPFRMAPLHWSELQEVSTELSQDR